MGELGPENGRNLKGRMVFEPHRQPLTQDGQPPNTTSNRQKEEEESEIPVNNFTGMPMMPLNHTTPRLGLSRSKAKVVKRIYPDGPYHWPSEGEKGINRAQNTFLHSTQHPSETTDDEVSRF